MIDYIKRSVYEGEWINDFQEGKGEESYDDGSKYIGYFSKGEKSGKGKLILKNGISYYEGEFLNDKLHGKGMFKWNKNKCYHGEWNNNEICGYGVLEEGDTIHVGYFDKDTKWGYGATKYLNSNVIILGKWENGELDGLGIIFLGDWRNSENEKLFCIEKGKIIKKEQNDDTINGFKKREDYLNMKKLFINKFVDEFNEKRVDNIIFNFE